jgi:DHA1 family bicyclomycin/chloramphenicol resistance-like MFS transporter
LLTHPRIDALAKPHGSSTTPRAPEPQPGRNQSGPPGRRLIRPGTFAFTLVLGLLGALPPLSIDISAPTLLTIQSQFGVTSAVGVLTITLFMVGFAAGQFTAGPLSDRHGRRPLLLLGLVAYTVAAIGCALAGSMTALVSWRLLQGAGAGACSVLTFAIIRDVFEGNQARAKRSYITVVFGVAPMLAPILGAFIMDQAGWRFVYVVLAIAGLALMLAVTTGIAESRPAQAVRGTMRGAYWMVLTNGRFMGLVAVNALSYGAIFAYIAGSPALLMGSLGLTPFGYGVVFACTAAMLTAGAWISGRSAMRGVTANTVLRLGLGLGAASGLALAAVTGLGAGSVAVIVPILMVHLFARGLTAPNIQHIALEPIQEKAGTAAATVGVIQILSGAVASGVVALLLPGFGASGVAVVIAGLSVAAVLGWTLMAQAFATA